MSRVGKIARRSLLIGSAALLGGVAFGVWRTRTPFANPLREDLPDGTASFNPWVLVDSTKITLITPHADKGQGVSSMQAALIAEEMDLQWGQFDTHFGAPDRAYWNTALAGEMVPFLSTDESLTARTMRQVMGGILKIAMPMQVTGGSSSVPDSFERLRLAGAVARETLKRAASQETGVPVAQLSTADGAVQLPDGSALAYTALARTAAQINPAGDVVLRPPAQWRLLGKPMTRLDMVPKSTGAQTYGIDLRLEGMVYATIKRNPHRGGVLRGYNADAARAMRGVHDIFEISGGAVAVVADNTWRAIQAAEALVFDWGAAPYPSEQAQHWETIANAFNEEHLDKQWRSEGDVAAALAGGDRIQAEYRAPYVAHQPLEPLNATLRITEARSDIWVGTQVPGIAKQQVAAITGQDEARVHLHNQFMGGSFGHRLEVDFIRQAAEIANRMRGTPVKMTYAREEDFAQDYPRAPGIARAIGTTKDGRVEALDLQVAMPSVITSQMGRIGLSLPGPDMQIAAGAWNNPYALPHFRMRAYRTPPLAPVSSWRSVGASANGFFFDSFLDELIHAAGADPMEERIRLMTHEVSRKVLEAVAEMCDWEGPRPAPNTGRGVAFVESFGVPTAEVVELRHTAEGIRIDKVWVACDVGPIVDPVNFENLVQGGVIFGLGHAINSEITYAGGVAEQVNFFDAEGMRIHQCPKIFVKGLENASQVRGIGEPPVPPAAPALANAIFAATGQRLRTMPFMKFVDFV
ncbi:MAG: xanthine dehydrogenase family protein molybdopterin-binding subunit [Rhodobacteraceae bacterium]|nr:xanthine dehydrogenase family protein molybdopterin-binding subunit [Paracoccaceae bacterium]